MDLNLKFEVSRKESSEADQGRSQGGAEGQLLP